MSTAELQSVFSQLLALLKKYEKRLDVTENDADSYALEFDKDYAVYSKKTGKSTTKHGLPFVSIQVHKDFVGFYFMPIYSHFDSFSLSEDLLKLLKGKHCFHIREVDTELKEELSKLIEQGYVLYKHYTGEV